MTCRFRVGSLFSGIGGFDLGLERTGGFEVVWQVEWDSYCQKVLAKHWPDIPCYGDIHEVGKHNLEKVDVLVGGFPCQPVSVAGKRKGQDDDRWLWPEFGRIIRELRPRYAIMENVPGLLVRGMGDVLGDLSEFGYDAEWGIVSAKSVGAPHLRKRIFIIGYTNGHYVDTLTRVSQGPHSDTSGSGDVADTTGPRSKARRSDAMGTRDRSRRDEILSQGTGGKAGDVAHANSDREEWDQPENWQRSRVDEDSSVVRSQPKDVADAQSRKSREQTQRQRGEDIERGSLDSRRSSDKGGKAGDVADAPNTDDSPSGTERRGPSMQPRRGGGREDVAYASTGLIGQKARLDGGNQEWWAAEPSVGRVAHGVPNRVDRLKGLGNAIVPQVAEYIGRRVLAHAESQEIKNGE